MAEQKSLLESTVRGFHVYALIDQDIVCLFFNMLEKVDPTYCVDFFVWDY